MKMLNALRVLNRHMMVFKHTWRFNIMYNFIDPFLNLAAMGFGLGAFVQDINGLKYSQFLAPGMIASSGMFTATFECAYGSFVRLHFQKSYHAMLAASLTVREICLGDIFYATFKSIIFGTVILAVITILGLVQSYWALLIPILLILPGLIFGSLALAYTGIITTIEYMNYYITLFITPLYLFSGVFFPVSSLPHWARIAAWFNPLFHVVEVFRALSLGAINSMVGLHLLILVVFAVIALCLPVRLMERRIIQ